MLQMLRTTVHAVLLFRTSAVDTVHCGIPEVHDILVIGSTATLGTGRQGSSQGRKQTKLIGPRIFWIKEYIL
jgi:hypothetical protein